MNPRAHKRVLELGSSVFSGLLTAFLFYMALAGLTGAQTVPAKPIPIKVVVVAMFERGEDAGDIPGEFQFWVEREHLDQILPLDAGYHHVRLN
jgi:purine nucleoside permease